MPCHLQVTFPCSWNIHCDSCALVSCLDMCISAAQPRQEKGESTKTDTAYHNPGKPQQTQIRVCKQGIEGTPYLQLCQGLTVTSCTQPLTDNPKPAYQMVQGPPSAFANLSVHRQHTCHISICVQAAHLPQHCLCTGSIHVTSLAVYRGARLP